MSYGFKVEVRGDYGLFTRPELKVERYSYDFITPSAARGILEAIFWKPAIKYIIDKITIINPIEFTNIKRNEIKKRISHQNANKYMKNFETNEKFYENTKRIIAQRNSTLLKNVHYIIDAHFEMTDKAGDEDNEDKFYAMILRRIEKGQCFHMPYFGCREFPVKFNLFEDENITSFYEGEEKDFGIMLYDLDYTDKNNIKPLYFRAFMKDGVIDLTDCEVIT